MGDKQNVVASLSLDFHGKAVQRPWRPNAWRARRGTRDFSVRHVLAGTQTNGKGLPGADAALSALAKEAGAGDSTALKACTEDAAVAARVQQDMQDGIRAGVEGTPGLILRDNSTSRAQLVGGAMPQEQMEQALRAFVETGKGA